MEHTFAPKTKAYQKHLASPKILPRAIGRLQGARAGLPLFLQRSALQPKLTINASHDPYEQEADRVADRVTQPPTTQSSTHSRNTDGLTQPVQLRPLIQTASESAVEAAGLEQRLAARRGQGRPLADAVQTSMSAGLGYNFSSVRVHTDSEAVHLNHALGTQAFTHRQDVYFGSGKYAPDSATGSHLLAHELTHVVQQTGSSQAAASVPQVQREDDENAPKLDWKTLPPEMKLSLQNWSLLANTGSTSLSYQNAPFNASLGYAYGGDLSLSTRYAGLSNTLGVNPKSGALSLGGSYDQLRWGGSINPSGTVGFQVGYGQPLLPMPDELKKGIYGGEAGLRGVLSGLSPFPTDPLQFYQAQKGNISSISGAAGLLSGVASQQDAKTPFGVGLSVTSSPEERLKIFLSGQYRF